MKLVDELEANKDNRDIGFQAFYEFNKYMENVEKCKKFWILSNTIYNKK